MSISATFANALSGLRVAGRQTQVASNNLANALTDGYGRQEVFVGSDALTGQGAGVRVNAVLRASAPEITASRREADGTAATASVTAEALAVLGRALGEATGTDGLFRRVEDFESALRQFAETPESAPRQLRGIETARDLVTILNGLSDQIATVRQNADAAIAADVATVNRNLAEIDRLNAQIQRLAITDATNAALIDERERLIDEISAIIPVRVQPQDHDVVHLYTAEGIFLLQEGVSELTFTRSPVITAPMRYDPAGGGVLSGLSLRGVDIAPASGEGQSVRTGTLAGHFAVRDDLAVTFQTRVDQFAADLITRFQDPAVDPTLAVGDPGLFTDAGAVLDPATIDGLVGRISVNALADPAQGGSAAALRDGLQAAAPGPVASDTIARNLLDALRDPRSAAAIPGLAGALGASEIVSGIVELTGTARVTAEAEAGRHRATREILAEGEAGLIGVDSDAELQNLIQIEQAFNANVQVVQTASRMLQELMELR